MMSNKKYTDLPDEELMDSFIRHNDVKAFSQIYSIYFPILSKYMIWLTHDSEKGKDIAQNILMKVYQYPESFDTSKNLKVWLLSIAKNQWKNESRNEATRAKHLASLPQELIAYQAQTKDDDPRIQQIKRALQNLSENHKEVFILKYSNNLSIKEISEICGCSEGTVKSRLFYALKYIRDANPSLVKN